MYWIVYLLIFVLFVLTFAVFSLSIVLDTQMTKSGHTKIQYLFDDKSYDKIIEHRLQLVMGKIEQSSCVRFERISSESERSAYTHTMIHITNPDNQRECSHRAYFDKFQNIIQLVLGLDCLQERQIFHSFLHGLGFNDEVTHPQRDKYVRVMWSNIQPKYRKLFHIKMNEFFAAIPFEYDPMSLMHFHSRAYTSNGHPTIIPVVPGIMINPSVELSSLDKMKLRVLFGQYCQRRRLTELLDSCKIAMTSEKQKQVAEEKEDDAIQTVDEQEGASDGKTNPVKENVKDSDAAMQDDNVSSSGPEIVAG